ncbi:hypothetical protein Pmani_000104 [Petrolisthes manimaculis]|uniref:C2H2-type domain-containing protein n=1 Tax=Petrolisthes manimaculis TaxID=1843537 RepID=A0AAE1PSF0_9EUCA|nr:hypothetical protein Pmani_014691 [Petrolisthes manimaculis]KAK4329555.1 hypothetical protein Pmani_000104 [Petrolisthes manimaculis]
MGSAGGVHRSPGQGRSPSNTRSPGHIRSPSQGISPNLIRSPASPNTGLHSKGSAQFHQSKTQSQPHSSLWSPGTSGCSTPSGRSPSIDGHSPSLTPSPLASLMPKLSNISGTPTSNCIVTGQQPSNTRSISGSGVASPIICDICNKSFTSRSNLNKHKRVQHSGEEYVCPICRRTFRNRYYIKEHVLLCSTATQKKAAAAAASGMMSGSPTQGGYTLVSVGGESDGLDESTDVRTKIEDGVDDIVDEKPTDLVLRRAASPT